MPSARDQWANTPREPHWQQPLPGSRSFGGYGPGGHAGPPDLSRTWDARPTPPSGPAPRSRGRGSGGLDRSIGAEDPRANPNSKYYDPEYDPHSRFYAGPATNGPTLLQPPHGGAPHALYGAYGVAPERPRPPRSAPPQNAWTDAAPRSPNRRGGSNRQGKRGNARAQQRVAAAMGGSSAAGVPYTSTEMAAAATLAKNGGSTDIGSLYYVLGTQVSPTGAPLNPTAICA